MTKFIFEDGEVIEVNDKAIADVIKTDKRYKELKDNEEMPKVMSVNKEIEELKVEKKALEKALEKANQVPKNAKELRIANDELAEKNEKLQKEVDDLKAKIEELINVEPLAPVEGDNDDKIQK